MKVGAFHFVFNSFWSQILHISHSVCPVILHLSSSVAEELGSKESNETLGNSITSVETQHVYVFVYVHMGEEKVSKLSWMEMMYDALQV